MPRNHKRPMSATERAHWRSVYEQVLCALIAKHDGNRSRELMSQEAADHADLAVDQLRQRVTWSRQ